jgi:hypothetical protein
MRVSLAREYEELLRNEGAHPKTGTGPLEFKGPVPVLGWARSKMVGMHTVDAPPPTRQPKCQAFASTTPSKMPSILAGDANQNAKQICKERADSQDFRSAAARLAYHEAGSLWFHERSGVCARAMLTR